MFRLLSIEITNDKIKIIEGSKSFNGKLLSVIKSLSLDIPPMVVEDGKINDIELLKDIIHKALSAAQIKARNVIFILNTSAVIIRNVELPVLKRKSQTASMIKIEFERLISPNLNHVIIYKKSDIIETDSGTRAKYIVYGLPISIYNQYIELSKMLKVNITALDISSNCLEIVQHNNIMINNDYANGTISFIYLDYTRIEFCVLNNGINEFARVIYLNNHDEELYQIDKIAENLNTYDLDLDLYLNAIYKYVRYYYSIELNNKIDKIYMYGSISDIEDIKLFLDLNLNIDVEIIKNIYYSKKSNVEFNSWEYFHGLLALFKDNKNTNFLTDKINKHKYKFFIGVIVMTTSILLLLTFLFHAQTYMIYKGLYKTEVENVRSYLNNKDNVYLNYEIEKLKERISYLEKYNEEVKNISLIISEENKVHANIFREIDAAKSEETIVVYISIDKNFIQMQCRSYGIDDIMLFIKNLRKTSYIDTVYTPLIDTANEGAWSYSYSVICKLRDGDYEGK